MADFYELDGADRELMVKVRTAVEYAINGDPIKDAIDDGEIVEALRLLVEVADAGYVK